ncbi:MAG: citramalate synthase [Candidatus Nezhaarchaeales archaeon]
MYDTTLRDGTQGRGVSFSLQDKISLTLKLDEFGVHFIEGGCPASNPKDREYFNEVGNYKLSNADVVAFTFTRRKDKKADSDPFVTEVLRYNVDVVAVVGNSSKYYVKNVLRVKPEVNLEMIKDTIEYLVKHGIKVIFDAEHFFDGYKFDSDYALKVIKEAEDSGAYRIVLCDTNGGSLPYEVGSIVTKVRRSLKTPIGIHCHNDAGVAVANTIEAVLAGAIHIQGTINGLGERCGNADLCQVIPNLELKLGIKALAVNAPRDERLRKLTEISAYVYDLANIPPNPYQPYVGKYAFAHKAGVHIDAVLKYCKAYEHISPEVVGNRRLLTVSEVVGRAGVVSKINELGFPVSKDDPAVTNILEEIKKLEYQGYQLEDADATTFLIILKHLGIYDEMFKVTYWRASVEAEGNSSLIEGAVRVAIGGTSYYEVSRGLGPVHAQDLALRKALSKVYPEVLNVHLVNYKVSVIDRGMGTASKVRVFMEFSDGKHSWVAVGVSTNILEASKEALISGYDYYLQMKRNAQLKCRGSESK